MKPVFYTEMKLDHGATVADICRMAHVLGYEMVPFNGYTDQDLGYAGNRGPKWNESRVNMAAINEVLDAHAIGHYGCYCSIFQCHDSAERTMEEEEDGLRIIRPFTR